MVWGRVVNPAQLLELGGFKEHKRSWKVFQHFRELLSKAGDHGFGEGGGGLVCSGLVDPKPLV